MKKYFIKDGYSEKGPLSIDDLKKLKISKTTFVKDHGDNSDWVQANSLIELKQLFRSKFWKIALIFLLFIVVVFTAITMVFQNANSKNEAIVEIENKTPPPTIHFLVSEHKKKILQELFKDSNFFKNKKQLIDACDYTNSIVRNEAVSIAGKDDGEYNIGQICDIFDYCYNNWKYVNDPKEKEIFEYASNTISNGLNGDCDDFAVLMCSMILSIGGEARINFAYQKDQGHAFTEVNIGENKVDDYISKRYKDVYSNSGIYSRIDKDGNHWLNLDWFAKYPGGDYFEYENGTSYYIIQHYCNDFTK